MHMDEVWYENRGTRLFALASGRGAPVILAHGGMGDHRAARVFCGPLGSRCRLVTPDLRGSGRSHFDGAITWDLLADDVAALVRHLGADRAIVGGVSAGAAVAVRFALRYRSLLARLIVITPGHGGAELGCTDTQRLAFQAMDDAARRAVVDGIEALYPLFDSLPDDIRPRAIAMASSFDPPSVAATTRFLATGAQPFGAGDELRAIAAPALLVPGDDPHHPAAVADVFARNLSRCTAVAAAGPAIGEAIAEFIA